MTIRFLIRSLCYRRFSPTLSRLIGWAQSRHYINDDALGVTLMLPLFASNIISHLNKINAVLM